jgi:hypothetical protein
LQNLTLNVIQEQVILLKEASETDALDDKQISTLCEILRAINSLKITKTKEDDNPFDEEEISLMTDKQLQAQRKKLLDIQ